MLTVRPQGSSLLKERSSHPPGQDPPVTQHSTSSAHSACPPYQYFFPHLRVHFPVLVVCVLMTYIGFCCIRCVVIVLRLSSWSDDPHLFLSSFNPYQSDPLTLPLLIHLSHNVVSPLFPPSHDIIVVLLILGELSHYLVTVNCCTSHTSDTINV